MRIRVKLSFEIRELGALGRPWKYGGAFPREPRWCWSTAMRLWELREESVMWGLWENKENVSGRIAQLPKRFLVQPENIALAMERPSRRADFEHGVDIIDLICTALFQCCDFTDIQVQNCG